MSDNNDTVLLLTEDDVTALLDTAAVYACTEEAFRLLGTNEAVNGLRTRTVSSGVTVNTMTAIAPTHDVLGVKTYPIVRTDVTQGAAFTVQLFQHTTGRLRALLRADALGQRRTGAASAVAAAHLARPGSTTLAVFGAGWQAQGQAVALTAALPSLQQILLVGRDPKRAASFRDDVAAKTRLEARVTHPREAAEAADIIVTATSAHTPVFDGRWLQPGALVCAAGSNYATKTEIDPETVRRADRVVVDALDVARAESGDLLAHLRSGGDGWDAVLEFGDVVAGKVPGRTSAQDIILFESQGLAILDVMAATHVVAEAERTGTRRTITW